MHRHQPILGRSSSDARGAGTLLAHRRKPTRVDVSGDDDAGMEVEKIMGDLRHVGLAGREAAGNPGALGVAPGGAGGGKPGTT